ncbi:MAG: class I adenylate-forming enzyme family protein [Planctomycetota bacterium]
MNIVERIRNSADRWEDQPAIIAGERTVQYHELLRKVAVWRRQFEEADIGSGSRVAFRCQDGVDYIVGSLALLETGAAIVPVHVSLPEENVDELVKRMNVTEIVSQKGLKPEGGVELGNGTFLCHWRESAESVSAGMDRIDPAFIRFSSGTTGQSKGVVLSHNSIYERTRAANEALQVGPGDRVLWVLSMSHHFVVSILLFLQRGATIVIGHRDFPASVGGAAGAGDITLIYASPFHYHMLTTDNSVPPGGLDNVRLAISTAMSLSEEVAHGFADKFGFYPAQAYGIIEVGLPFINLDPSPETFDSVGRKLPAYDVKLADRDDDGVGEVLLRGRGLFDAYVSPLRFRAEVLDDGWFRTGDLGRIDDHGYLRIRGRKKSVIICAGMKVFPEEVEHVLDSHPSVRQSLVTGVPHSVYGQIPVARVVLEEGVDPEDEMEQELLRRCYARLPSISVPKDVQFVEELPTTPSGKLLRRGCPPNNPR